MKKTFVIDDVAYCVEVDNNEVYFYIVSSESKLPTSKNRLIFYGDSVEDHIYTKTEAKNPVKVIRHVMSVIEDYISEKEPRFFRYKANEIEKFSLYHRLSEKICSKYNYICTFDENEFRFDRLY